MTQPRFTPRRKIALVIRHLAGRSGGAERIYCELANFLVESGLDVSCLVFDEPGAEPFYALDPRIELIHLDGEARDNGAKARKMLYKLMPKPLGFRDRLKWHSQNDRFVRQLERYIDGAAPDLMISLLPTANTPVLVAARDRKVKVVVTNHNVPAEDYDNPARWGGGDHDRKMRVKMLDRADAIHVLFPGFGEWFPKRLQDRVVAIPNYVSDDILAAGRNDEPRDKLILGVGRLSSVKNYAALVEAWGKIAASHSDWRIRIFGVGPETGRLKSRIEQLGLSDRIELAGVTRSIADEYRRSAILCHPAHFEGFGLTVAEALACETPVLAFEDTPGLKEFLVDGENAILVPRGGDEVAALADGLDRMLKDTELRDRLGRNGPGSVKRFSKEIYLQRWLSLVDRLSPEAVDAKR